MDPQLPGWCETIAEESGNYSWSQTHQKIHVFITIPETISAFSSVSVDIQESFINVAVLAIEGKSELKKGHLFEKIDPAKSSWKLLPHGQIHVWLQKVEKKLWDTVFKDEIECDDKGDSKHLGDEVQAAVETNDLSGLVKAIDLGQFDDAEDDTSLELLEMTSVLKRPEPDFEYLEPPEFEYAEPHAGPAIVDVKELDPSQFEDADEDTFMRRQEFIRDTDKKQLGKSTPQ